MHGWGMGGAGGGFPGFHQRPRRFEETYHCYSVAFADKPHLEVCYLLKKRKTALLP